MTLSNFLRSATFQGGIVISAWEDGNEAKTVFCDCVEHSGEVIAKAKEARLLSKKVTYVFANCDDLRIEVEI